MRRVALVSEARAVGGAEIYLDRLARSLAGWTALVAVPDREPLAAWGRGLAAAGLETVAYDPGFGGVRRLAARLREARVDLIHVNLPSTYDGSQGLLPWYLSRSTGRPVVVTEHLTDLPRSRRRRWLKLATGGRVAAVITVSEASRRTLAGEGVPEEKIVAIANGVPDPGPPAALPSGDDGLRVGVLAALEPRKQIDLLLQAASRATDGRLRLEIAGDGPSRGILEGLSRRLGLERVVFHGTVDDPYRLLAGCHVLALPSRLEAMPLSVLESLASGRGVLLSDLPGMNEIVRHGATGWLLPAGDVGAWAAALDRLAGEPGTVELWSRAARTEYEARFTLAASARATTAVYERALGGGG